jgi:Ni,Fe-hydrogenase III small subunit
MKEKIVKEFKEQLMNGPMIARHPIAGCTYTPQQAMKALQKVLEKYSI